MFVPTHMMTRGNKPCGIEKIDHKGPHRSIGSMEKIAAYQEARHDENLEYWRKYNAARRPSPAVPCEVCGNPCYSMFKVCRKTEECTKEHKSRWNEYQQMVIDEKCPPIYCELCGGRLTQKSSVYGVCHVNPDCVPEYNRRRRENPRIKATTKKTRKEQIAARRHDELTYLMYSPGLNSHKIGRTTYIEDRYKMLKCGCWDLELVTTFPYDRKLERWLHLRFDANRIQGTEWFTDLTEVDVKNAVAEYESLLAG